MAAHFLTMDRVAAMSVSTALLLVASREREDRRMMVKFSAGAFAAGLCIRGMPNWLRGRSFLSYQRAVMSLQAAAVAPLLYASRSVLSRSKLGDGAQRRLPRSAAGAIYYPYLVTACTTAVGASCASVLLGYGVHLLAVHGALACAVGHYAWDFGRRWTHGLYRKQVLRLHFPAIADELDVELQVTSLPVPYVTEWSRRYEGTTAAIDELACEMTELEREVQLYRALQAEVYRLREQLNVVGGDGDGGGGAAQAS